ncbi:MAG: hypothetical protein DRI57_15965 [Deltaproteobacteria bacterium]|nr:MAG: hypothetical protein DRI57_15965 [Deltaproteobacteria bacterium]
MQVSPHTAHAAVRRREASAGDARRSKKQSAARQAELLLLTIRNKINNQIKDFMSHPLQFGVIFSFTICLNCNFFAATVNVQYLNIRFSSYIALFGPKKMIIGTVCSQNKQAIRLILDTYHGPTQFYPLITTCRSVIFVPFHYFRQAG